MGGMQVWGARWVMLAALLWVGAAGCGASSPDGDDPDALPFEDTTTEDDTGEGDTTVDPTKCGGLPCDGGCCGGICVNLLVAASNCGECGNVCAADETCANGACFFPCERPERLCAGDVCADTSRDPNNCGECGNVCGASQVCWRDTCRASCEGDDKPCAGTCADVLADNDHCGQCGRACGGGEVCQAGACLCAEGFRDCNGLPDDGCEVQGQSCACTPNAQRTCYTGSPETRFTGACKDGLQTCAPDASGWTACLGEVRPNVEICGDNIDNDCDNQTDEDEDTDGDGWGICNGDCCDNIAAGCATNPSRVNPGAFDFVGNSVDDDCDGQRDNLLAQSCSTSALFSGVTATDLVRAMGLCQFADLPGRWGVISAGLFLADGTGAPDPRQVAVLQGLGSAWIVTPTEGATMTALSSGTARGVGDPGYTAPLPQLSSFATNNTTSAPAVYLSAHNNTLQTSAACPAGASQVNDPVMLRIRMRAPSNAEGFSFRFRFFSSEYPTWLCSAFNDFFVVLLDSDHPAIATDRNISFDSAGNPVSVNNAFFTTCQAQTCGYERSGRDVNPLDGCPDSLACDPNLNLCASPFGACPDGASEVQAYVANTSQAGATSWLTTQAPVIPGEEITLEFMIWDTSDHFLDSLVLIDGFEWRIDPTENMTFN